MPSHGHTVHGRPTDVTGPSAPKAPHPASPPPPHGRLPSTPTDIDPYRLKPLLQRRPILAVLGTAAAIAGTVAGALAVTSCSAASSTGLALRTTNTPAGKMVVTGTGLTVYIYLPDQTHPSETTCTGDCANDWPPILSTSSNPKISGIDRSRVGSVTRPDGTRQLTLNGYPLYRFAADQSPGDTRGESVGNTWFAIAPDGSFLGLSPESFQPTQHRSSQALQVIATRAGRIVADSDGQTLYIYKDDTPTTSACTASWCVQDWPPLLVKQPPPIISGLNAPIGVLRRPDGTPQLTLAGHPLYRFSGDQLPGDLYGLGIGQDWYPITPDGAKVAASGSS